jgi:hypothetical protein
MPDRSHKAGENITSGRKAKISSWILSTKDVCKAKDFKKHIAWLLDKLKGHRRSLHSLIKKGYEIRILCFYETDLPNFGPIIDHKFINYIAEYPIDLDFDVWFNVKETRRTNEKRKTERKRGRFYLNDKLFLRQRKPSFRT